MIHVCDTHALVWFLSGQRRRLGRRALALLDRASSGLGEIRVSVASLHEVAILLERGRLRSLGDWGGWIERVKAAPGLGLEPVTIEDVEHARDFSMLDDPFDRLVAGTARRLSIPLISADERIRGSRLVAVVW